MSDERPVCADCKHFIQGEDYQWGGRPSRCATTNCEVMAFTDASKCAYFEADEMCGVCGAPMFLADGHIPHHLDENGQIDHEIDADHTAIVEHLTVAIGPKSTPRPINLDEVRELYPKVLDFVTDVLNIMLGYADGAWDFSWMHGQTGSSKSPGHLVINGEYENLDVSVPFKVVVNAKELTIYRFEWDV